jgi:hypothetical protein
LATPFTCPTNIAPVRPKCAPRYFATDDSRFGLVGSEAIMVMSAARRKAPAGAMLVGQEFMGALLRS